MSDILNKISAPQPKLLLKTNFNTGVSLATPIPLGGAGNYTVNVTYVNGTDANSGYDVQNSFKAYLGTQTFFMIQQLPGAAVTDGDAATANATFATLFTSQLQSTTIPTAAGGRELLLKLIQRNGTSLSISPQCDLLLQRYRDDFATTNAIPVTNINSIAWKFHCILDTNLTNLSADAPDYMDLIEYKSGDMRSTYPAGAFSPGFGSCRFSVLILKGANGLYFSSRYDNVAGTVGVYPANYNSKTGFVFTFFTLGEHAISNGDQIRGKNSLVTATAAIVDLRVGAWTGAGKGAITMTNVSGTFTDGEKLQVWTGSAWVDACTCANYWSGQESVNLALNEQKYILQETPGGSVPLGVPLEFAVRIVRPKSRTDITSGITQVVMTNLNTGVKTVICNMIGGIQMGSGEDPISRIFIAPAYSNYNRPNAPINLSHKITNVEVWSDFPKNETTNTANLIADFGDIGNGITLGALTRTTVGDNKNFEQALTGTGSTLGKNIPDSLKPGFGEFTSVYAQYLTDQDSYLAADVGTPKVTDYLSTTIAPITGVSADTVNLLSEFNTLKIAPYYLENKIINRGVPVGSNPAGTPQLNIQLNRSRTYTGTLREINSIYMVSYVKWDANLGTNLLYPPGSPAQNWISPGIEYKTGQYNGSYDAGDFRLLLQIVKLNTGLSYCLQADANAGGSVPCVASIPTCVGGDTTPCLTGGLYWQYYNWIAGSGVSALNYPVELDKWLKIEFFTSRPSSYTDLTSGRTWVAITPMDTMVRTKVFDVIGGVHIGCATLPITRIFFNNAYSGGVAPYYNRVAGVRIWDNVPAQHAYQ